MRLCDRIPVVASRIVGSTVGLIVSALMVASGAMFAWSEDWWKWLDRVVYILTFWIAVVIQGAQNRDTRAMQIKLDELIRASDARNEVMGIERAPAKELGA